MIRNDRSFWMFVLLSIVTCGIYPLYFWYCVSVDVNTMCEGDGEETMNFLLAWLIGLVTCGIFIFFWYYKLGDRLQRNANRYGITIQENGSTVLLWMLVGMLVCGVGSYYARYILIRNVNTLATAYNGGGNGGPGAGGYGGNAYAGNGYAANGYNNMNGANNFSQPGNFSNPVNNGPVNSAQAAPALCKTCGTPLTPGSKFCGKCGTVNE